ncbi:MAG TPA: DUF2520 domain-containing protein [Blastocatellia bacterium]|nr:DUF2520 domain-containing protein [Blastocatellia bacterium]
MKITIIGAGRVGQALGRLAREAGYEIADVVSTSRRSAAASVRFIGAGRAQAASRARLSAADLILIATPDDKITAAVGLIEKNALTIGRAIALHTSGAIASDALKRLTQYKIAIGSCHPLQTFESPDRALSLVPASYFCIEGEPRAVRAARRLVRDIGARYFEIPTEMKSLYHAAAVMASGGVVALLSISLQLLERCGLSETQSQRVLLPLVEGTVANVRAVGPARALTGPVRRGDTGTVERNMKAIAAVDNDWLEVYRLLAERGLALAERAGATHESLARLLRSVGSRQ